VTQGHKCGKCGSYGHGDYECNNNIMVYRLRAYYDDTMPSHLECTVVGCAFKTLHSNDAHHCHICNTRDDHTVQDCPMNNVASTSTSSQVPAAVPKIYNVKCPVCRVDNIVINPRKIFGLNDECCICSDNNVEVLFPTCYHCCICLECLEKI
jgi:hypothetical protein